MRLVRLEIRNYRSIKELVDDNAILFQGLDCLVGKNNAGKSNILKAILYLLAGETHSPDLHYGRDISRIIDVRGYFEVVERDFDLLKIDNKREAMKQLVLADGTIGFCRRSDTPGLQLIGYHPRDGGLGKEAVRQVRDQAWDQKAKADFRGRMQSEYPELVPFLREGKESQKGEWLEAYDTFVAKRPQGTEFVEAPGPPPTGISADPSNMLPRPVFVPAVKEVSDATRTARTAELGGLLADLSGEVKEELDGLINEALADVSTRLNVVRDASTGHVISDERHAGVRAIESQIARYMADTFQDISICLEFPNPESRVMFENARIWVEEEGFSRVGVEYAGEGVKRVLIFSLIRTLADLRQGSLSVSGTRDLEDEVQDARRSLLVLYEEAELFLHPGLQRILLIAFDRLRDSGDQVIFSTHSPFMLPDPLASTIGLVRKDPQAGTAVVEAHRRLGVIDDREQNRLLQVQNVSSYVFADRVVLVEGESDRIVLRKVAPALDTKWAFEERGIPILPVAGKGDLALFHDFLRGLGIKTFVLTDLDAVEDILARLCESEPVRETRDRLVGKCQQLVDAGAFQPRIASRHISKLRQSHDWKDVVEQLECLCVALRTGAAPTEEQIGCLERLLAIGQMDPRRRALRSDDSDVRALRMQLIELLLSENVLCLSGTIEDYYPSQAHGVEAALEFEPTTMSRAELCSHFTLLSDGCTTDMEAFLRAVFEPDAPFG